MDPAPTTAAPLPARAASQMSCVAMSNNVWSVCTLELRARVGDECCDFTVSHSNHFTVWMSFYCVSRPNAHSKIASLNCIRSTRASTPSPRKQRVVPAKGLREGSRDLSIDKPMVPRGACPIPFGCDSSPVTSLLRVMDRQTFPTCRACHMTQKRARPTFGDEDLIRGLLCAYCVEM